LEQLDFEGISAHISHHIVAIQYGDPPVNATIECETCGTVIYSADPTKKRRTQPVEMWQFALLNGGTVEQQVLAGLEFEHEITNYATVATAKALGIPLAALSGDEDDAWAEMLEAAHEHAFYAVSLDKVTVLQFGDDVPRSDVLMRRPRSTGCGRAAAGIRPLWTSPTPRPPTRSRASRASATMLSWCCDGRRWSASASAICRHSGATGRRQRASTWMRS
jgi:hypothetical protein